ncbi:MAG: cytochrome c biogenesis protein CcdA [Anaerolineales bacterium]|nr:cytochrome c biogenesis protein CcdA [Anaerolineales bacterium]MBS3751893.1 cytochrome c biogenesis protein CcdA [Anaerolineales bacterium]
MGSANISIGLSFLAGLASFLSPCVFPLVPAYISYLGGRSGVGESEEERDRWKVFTHGVAFVLGFSLVFIILGVATSALGTLLQEAREWIAKIGGMVVVIFGIHMTGIWKIPFLQYDLRKQARPDQKGGYIASLLMGVFFSAGWSPCVGPVLGAILTLSISGGSVLVGASLLAAYSAGLAIPFLVAALGMGWVSEVLQRHGKAMHYVEVVMGVVLIVVGIMLFLGTFESLARYGSFITIDF